MCDFTITERKEPFTLNEVLKFIDDTNISKLDACELKSRIVDVICTERKKAVDDFTELLEGNLLRKYANANLTQQYVALQVTDWCNEIAEQLKEGGEK